MNKEVRPDDIYISSEEITWRDVNGELVVLKLTSGEYFSFNEVGRLTWLNLTEGKSIKEIVKVIEKEYDVTTDQAQSDVYTFIEGLLENQLLNQE